jgi:hypothetical protein
MLHVAVRVLRHYATGEGVGRPKQHEHEACKRVAWLQRSSSDTNEEQECVEQRLQRSDDAEAVEGEPKGEAAAGNAGDEINGSKPKDSLLVARQQRQIQSNNQDDNNICFIGA